MGVFENALGVVVTSPTGDDYTVLFSTINVAWDLRIAAGFYGAFEGELKGIFFLIVFLLSVSVSSSRSK